MSDRPEQTGQFEPITGVPPPPLDRHTELAQMSRFLADPT
jgi:hypothetical protein